jgi:hypothetical protein
MRTTVNIADTTPERLRRLTGKKRLGEAIDALVDEAEGKRLRIELIDMLRAEKTPHDWKKIKAARRARSWVA